MLEEAGRGGTLGIGGLKEEEIQEDSVGLSPLYWIPGEPKA